MTDLQPQLGTCLHECSIHGLHGGCLCAKCGKAYDQYSHPFAPAPQARPAPPENPRTWVDKTPAYVEGEQDQQTWPCTGCGNSRKLNEACFGARVSVGVQPGCPECGGIPCANLDVCKAPAPDLEQQLTDAAFPVGSNSGNSQLVVDLGEAIDIVARSHTGSYLNWERDCPKCGDCPKPCLCSCHVGTANDPRKAAPPSSPGAPQSRADDNLNSAVRQYRHAVHGMDCTCKDCTRLLKILVSDNYELSSPGADTEKKSEKCDATGQTEEETSDGLANPMGGVMDNSGSGVRTDGDLLSRSVALTSQSMPAPDVLRGLQYIADSPAQEHGGFHPEAVKTAKAAIEWIQGASSSNAATEKILADARLIADGEKLWKGVKWVDMCKRAETAEQSRDTWKDCAEKTGQLVVKTEAERDSLREALRLEREMNVAATLARTKPPYITE